MKGIFSGLVGFFLGCFRCFFDWFLKEYIFFFEKVEENIYSYLEI